MRGTTWRSCARSSTRRASRARPTPASSPPCGRPATSPSRRRAIPRRQRPRPTGTGRSRASRAAWRPRCARSLSPVARQLGELRTSLAATARKSSPDLEAAARNDIDEHLESIRRKLVAVQEFVAELAAVGESDPHELQREVDLVEVVRSETRALDARIARTGVDVEVVVTPEAAARAPARVSPRSTACWFASSSRTPSPRRRAEGASPWPCKPPGRRRGTTGWARASSSTTAAPSCPPRLAERSSPSRSSPGPSGARAAWVSSWPRRLPQPRAPCSRSATLRSTDGHGGGVRVTVTFPRSGT